MLQWWQTPTTFLESRAGALWAGRPHLPRPSNFPAPDWPPRFGQLSSDKEFQPLQSPGSSSPRKPQSASQPKWVRATQGAPGWADQQACGYSSALRALEVLGWGWRGCTSPYSRNGSRPMGTASCHLVNCPNFKATAHLHPSEQEQDSLDTWLPLGRAQASPRPHPACLHKALSGGSGAGSHKPHPQLEMKPELRDAGSSVPGPTPGTASPTRAPAPGLRPYSRVGRGHGCYQGPSGFSPRQAYGSTSGPACCLPACSVQLCICRWSKNMGPTPNFPTPQQPSAAGPT